MAADSLSPGSRQARGKRIKHPPSTNFNDDQEHSSRKRLKRFISIESAPSEYSEGDSALDTPEEESPRFPDSGAEDTGNEDERGNTYAGSDHGTELESALPPVKTDKDAIEDYESFRKAETEKDLTLEQRLEGRKWVKGRSSIYVDAFNLALETVLAEEKHLFDETELALFSCWQELPYEAQYL